MHFLCSSTFQPMTSSVPLPFQPIPSSVRLHFHPCLLQPICSFFSACLFHDLRVRFHLCQECRRPRHKATCSPAPTSRALQFQSLRPSARSMICENTSPSFPWSWRRPMSATDSTILPSHCLSATASFLPWRPACCCSQPSSVSSSVPLSVSRLSVRVFGSR